MNLIHNKKKLIQVRHLIILVVVLIAIYENRFDIHTSLLHLFIEFYED